MKEIPKANRFYICGFPKGKTHLVYFRDNLGGFNDEVLVTLCMSSLPIEVQRGYDCDYYTDDATREDAEEFDRYYNEVTCPTCLKIARGKTKFQESLF